MNKKIKSSFIGIDLHVHTPSSSCYLDEKSDDEYFLIIEKYVEKGIKAIAITDHNTIAGYKKILHLINTYKTKIDILSEFKDNAEIHNEVLKIQNKLDVINKLIIFPGIEFEADPGIHLLFIFNQKN